MFIYSPAHIQLTFWFARKCCCCDVSYSSRSYGGCSFWRSFVGRVYLFCRWARQSLTPPLRGWWYDYSVWWRSAGVCVSACVSSPGGVYASMEVCTTSERLLEGIGTATFLSTCRANTACTASVWTSEREREREIQEETSLREFSALLNVFLCSLNQSDWIFKMLFRCGSRTSISGRSQISVSVVPHTVVNNKSKIPIHLQ